jgi:hypothetical protein
MKKIFELSIILSLSMTFSACNQIKGEGPIITKEIGVDDFDGVALEGSFNVVVNQGIKTVVAEGHGNIIDRLDAEVRDGVLILELENGYYRDYELNVSVSTNMLQKLEVSGSGDMKVGSFSKLNDLVLSVDGSGNLKSTSMLQMSGECQINIAGSGDVVMELEAKDLEVSIAGSGNVKVSGIVEEQDITIAGSGDYVASKLKSTKADVIISGSGNVKVDVVKELEVSIAGSGDVTYSGSPDVESKVMGSGDVRRAK